MYFLIQYGLLTVVCLYLISYYAAKDVSPHIRVWSLITWVLNFGLALLIPQDVFLTLQNDQQQKIREGLSWQYLLQYWSVYLLTWTVIPVLQEWQDAGDLQSRDRLRRSLRNNAIFYVWLLVPSLLFLLLLWLMEAGGQMGLFTYLKCLATSWGILLLIILLGYSLVEIPKTMWRNADPQVYLTYLYNKVIEMSVQVDVDLTQFQKIDSYINFVQRQTEDSTIIEYCNSSQKMVPLHLRKSSNHFFQESLREAGYFEKFPICLQSSIEHRRLMKRVLARIRRNNRIFQNYISQAIIYEDVLEALQRGDGRLQSYLVNRRWSWWYLSARKPVLRGMSVLVGICSLVILISQTQVFLAPDSSLLAYLLIIEDYEMIRIAVFGVITFIVYMANYALFRIKLANLYGLYPHESDGPSLMFATVNISRIGIAVVLNFFNMIKLQGSTYAEVLAAPSMGLLGQWVIQGLPGILWLIVLTHYFNVWSWVANKLGVQNVLAFSSHQFTKVGEKREVPTFVVIKRRQLDEDHSSNVMNSQ